MNSSTSYLNWVMNRVHLCLTGVIAECFLVVVCGLALVRMCVRIYLVHDLANLKELIRERQKKATNYQNVTSQLPLCNSSSQIVTQVPLL